MIEYKGGNREIIEQLSRYKVQLESAVQSVFGNKLPKLAQESRRLLNYKSFDDFPNLDHGERIFSRRGDSTFLLSGGVRAGTKVPIISASGKIINNDRNFALQTTPSILLTEGGAQYMGNMTGNREIGHLAAYVHEAYGHFAFYALTAQSPSVAIAFIMAAQREGTARCNPEDLKLALLDTILYEENVVNSIQSIILSRAGFVGEGEKLIRNQEVSGKIFSTVKQNIESGNLDAVYNWKGKVADNKFVQNLGRTMMEVPHIKTAKV